MLLAQKKGVTQIFNTKGERIPVTVLRMDPSVVVMRKTKGKDGYAAVQLGYGRTAEKKLNKPLAGHFKKKQMDPCRTLAEMRTDQPELYAPGSALGIDLLKAGDSVDITGISKGKGFQGVMKRHHFAGGRKSHGVSVAHRVPGSIGQRTFPGRVMRGKKMPGQMGNEQVTVKNLTIADIDAENSLLMISGAVPGGRNSLVSVCPRRGELEKRYAATQQKKDEKKEEKKEEK